MRAREPSSSGFAVRGGVRIAYDVFGEGDRTLVFVPPWSIVHSRCWKAQIPYFARHARVVTFDGRGNGRSDKGPSLDYSDEAFAADLLAVMDASSTEHATLVALSAGCRWALMVAARYPHRVDRLICIAPAVQLGPGGPDRAVVAARFGRSGPWREWYREFLDFFFREALPEPHSTKQIEDCIQWGLDTTPETVQATVNTKTLTPEETAGLARSVRCPVLVIHGDDDRIIPPWRGRALADLTGGDFVSLAGSGHLPQARIPVHVNAVISEALDARAAPSRKRSRKKRALFISSPIGLGHAQRDYAMASELRAIRSDIQVEWLAQHPVTELLRAHGEKIHPASGSLVNETAHLESECGEHDLHAFQAIRRMDEILVGNFMVLYDLLREEHFDLVVGDEAWDVDHFLHEHPNEKRAAFVWLTDFVGWLPMPDGGEYERRLTADYNAEMIEHVDRFPRIRDRSVFVGERDDIVPGDFGPGLPGIREWTQAHYAFPGYITGFTPPSEDERERLRARFEFKPGETICIATVGGSGVGQALLRHIIEAYAAIKERVPNLRMIAVAGPRIDPSSLPVQPGLEILPYVPELYLRLAACDIALVQGGLTTTMELTASQRPFIYFPLRHHFEQNFHVRHRLERYGAGRCMQFTEANPSTIADAVYAELRAEKRYREVDSRGAAKAAELIAEVL